MNDINLPDEPYWRCNRCGMMFLDSFKGEIICGDIDHPINQACPMEYIEPTPFAPIVHKPVPGRAGFRMLAFLVLLIAALVIVGLTACTQRVPDEVCTKSHDETAIVPILTGFTNNVPQYTYIPQTDTVCDEARPTTAQEKLDWCRANPDGEGCSQK